MADADRVPVATPTTPAPMPLADRVRFELAMAKVWEGRGKIERALEGYARVLRLSPQQQGAAIERVRLLDQLGRFADVAAEAGAALERFPQEASLHKRRIRAIQKVTGGLDAACEAYDLRPVTPIAAGLAEDALLCCSVVRNERVRLPHWLAFYRRHGVSQFLIVDNGSSDGTSEWLAAQPDVSLWRSGLSFTAANFGSAWFEILLQRHGVGHWVLMVDADELLYFADSEHQTVRQLCADLDVRQKRAFFATLIDMYSDRPVAETRLEPGMPFEDACPFFDRQFFHRRFEHAGPCSNLPMVFGGVRERVFGAAGDFLLSKIPLLKYSANCMLAGGQHWTNYAESEIAESTGALLHFKFVDSFPAYARQEAIRKEHADAGLQYETYARGLESAPGIRFYDPALSTRFTGSASLEPFGVFRQLNDRVQPFARGLSPVPEILPMAPGTTRPFWTVMVTVFDRTAFLTETLEHLLGQGDVLERMDIEVVQDGGAPAQAYRAVEDLVARVGQGRIRYRRMPVQLGQPDIFNDCVRRATGEWIHLLHDDDWVDPGFYAALEAGIQQAPSIGAALTGWCFAGDGPPDQHQPRPEASTAGVLEDWNQRIAIHCRVQMAAIVVRRTSYEALGGFWSEAGSAFDWDMWKRVAMQYPVWYEPRPLAHFRRHDGSLSHGLIASGQQIAHARRSIMIAQSSWPPDRAQRWTAAALDHYAQYAFELAGRQIEAGHLEAALRNVEEGLQCSRTDCSTRSLMDVLQRTNNLRGGA